MQRKRYLKIGLKIVAILVGLVVIAWTGIYIYLANNTAQLKKKLTEEFNKSTNAELIIGRVEPGFLSTFPYISLELHDVHVRDSMFRFHQRELLNSQFLYLRVSPVSLLSRSRVGRVIIRDASIDLFTDTSGYSNTYIIKGKNQVTSEEDKDAPGLPDIALERVKLNFENPQKNKLHKAEISRIICKIGRNASGLNIRANLNMNVISLAFNTDKGSYIRNKPVSGNIRLRYDVDEEKLQFKNIVLRVDGAPLRFTGWFSTNSVSPDFNLDIAASQLQFSKAVSFLPDTLQSKLKLYNLEKPIDLVVHLKGKTQYKQQPQLIARASVENNTIISPVGNISEANFQAEFTNEVDPRQPRLDPNSRLRIRSFTGKWGDIPIASKEISVTHMKRPYLECDIQSEFPLRALNELTGSQTLQFTEGSSAIDITFSGPIGGTDSTQSSLGGKVELKEAGMRYIPRNLVFSKGNGTLEFSQKDVLVRKLNLSTGRSTIVMNGIARNILSMLNISPEKLTLEWNINSPFLHLEDFAGFLSPQQSPQQSTPSERAIFQRTSGNIDKMFVEGDVLLSLDAPRMDYKKFNATDFKADVKLTQQEVALERASLKHAGGSIDMSGSMKDGGGVNRISFKTRLNKMEIPRLFTAFNNFGQDALTSTNIRGRVSADVNLRASITDKAEFLRESAEGTVDFLVEDGELIRFEPMMKVSETALKKQDMTHIKFANLENRLELKGTAFLIEKMEIRSTAFTMFVEGIYDIVKGTDMSIQFPLRNLTKDQADTDLSDNGGKGAGVAIRLRARTGEDGNLKVSWDPFRRSLRKKEAVEDSLKDKGKP